MEQIGALIEAKLADFRKDFLGNAVRSSLLASAGSSGATAALTADKKAKRKGRATAPLVVSVPAPPCLSAVPAPVSPRALRSLPPFSSLTGEELAKVVERKEKRAARKKTAAQPPPPPKKGNGGKVGLERPPKTAAVTVTVPESSGLTYAEVMSTARSNINLTDLGITEVRPK